MDVKDVGGMYVLEPEITSSDHGPNTTAELECANANGASEPATVCFALATALSKGRGLPDLSVKTYVRKHHHGASVGATSNRQVLRRQEFGIGGAARI